ncbi:MAG: radical SAM protein [Candidatus Aenigmatarchaeota archaeon]
MDGKIERLIEWSAGRRAAPFTLDINPTDKCNFKCKHCWQRAFEKIDFSYELSDKKLIEVVKEAIKFGVEEFEITGGGEPLMRKELTLKIMEVIKKNKKFGNITTNGSLLNLEDIKKMVKIGWDRITFSLDGADPKSNDAVRGKGSFEQVMNSIKLLNDVKKKMKSNLPIIKFNVVVNRKNYRVEKMIELAKKVNCSIVHFDSLTIHSKMGEKLKLTKRQQAEFEKHAKIAKQLAEKFKIWTDVNLLTSKFLEKSNEMEDLLEKESDSKDFFSLVCYEPWWHLVIKTNGTAQPCCLYDEKEESVKNKSLREIWFGEFFEKIRKSIKQKHFSKYCSICNAGQVFENRRIREELGKWRKK